MDYLGNKYICDNAKTLTFGFVSNESSLYSLYEKVMAPEVCGGRKIEIVDEIFGD